MKLCLSFFGAVSFGLLVGCSSSTRNSSSGDEPPSPVPGQVMQKVGLAAQLPAAGDSGTLQFLQFYSVPSALCGYVVTETATVTHRLVDFIEITYDRENQPSQKNSFNCPLSLPHLQTHEVKSWTVKDYTQARLADIQQALDPAQYVRETPWAQSARIVSSTEINNYRGVHSQVIDMDVVSHTGVHFTYRQYVALDVFFLGRFEYVLFRNSDKGLFDYQQLIRVIVPQLGLN